MTKYLNFKKCILVNDLFFYYSCWDDKKLIGTTRLQVVDKEMGEGYKFYILNTAVLFTFIIILMISVTVCKNVRLQSKE